MSSIQERVRQILPGDFDPPQCWYPRALNAQIHPMVAFFMSLGENRIIGRYCHLNPQVDREVLASVLAYKPRYLLHAGADLFHVTNEQGQRKMVVIETNSSPSGHKSMPLLDENQEMGGYYTYMKEVFQPAAKARRKGMEGALAVLYDKNPMEALGYAGAMAEVFKEPVYFVPFYHFDADPPARFNNQVLEIRDESGAWHSVRAAFRYVTQRPWNRIPIQTRTLILNPIISCLAGGRNKMTAAKAYDLYNAELQGSGLQIHTPYTIWDVRKNEIPLWVKKLGGHAVIKVPYGNAGQGVYTVVNQQELDAFMAIDHGYEMFIVQSLIGNYNWSSRSENGKLYHVGTMPNSKNLTFVADLRIMVGSTATGLRPLAIYARRANAPLLDQLDNAGESWDMLGTNLSYDLGDGRFSSDSSRLLMMDRRDFNKLGISVDELIEGYIQTILSMIAIDKLAQTLINKKGGLKSRLFAALNNDESLIGEIIAN